MVHRHTAGQIVVAVRNSACLVSADGQWVLPSQALACPDAAYRRVPRWSVVWGPLMHHQDEFTDGHWCSPIGRNMAPDAIPNPYLLCIAYVYLLTGIPHWEAPGTIPNRFFYSDVLAHQIFFIIFCVDPNKCFYNLEFEFFQQVTDQVLSGVWFCDVRFNSVRRRHWFGCTHPIVMITHPIITGPSLLFLPQCHKIWAASVALRYAHSQGIGTRSDTPCHTGMLLSPPAAVLWKQLRRPLRLITVTGTIFSKSHHTSIYFFEKIFLFTRWIIWFKRSSSGVGWVWHVKKTCMWDDLDVAGNALHLQGLR